MRSKRATSGVAVMISSKFKGVPHLQRIEVSGFEARGAWRAELSESLKMQRVPVVELVKIDPAYASSVFSAPMLLYDGVCDELLKNDMVEKDIEMVLLRAPSPL